MKLFWSLIAAGTVVTLGAAQTPAQPVRVGTFHTSSVVVAFYRSPLWAERLKEKKAESEAAKKAGDTKKVQELNDWGAGGQELAHRQLSGDAPIPNILEALAPAFPQIAQKAQVSIIVQDLPYAAASVETVQARESASRIPALKPRPTPTFCGKRRTRVAGGAPSSALRNSASSLPLST